MLRTLQQEVVDRIEADEWFEGVPVIASTKGDLIKEIDEGLGKINLCVTVRTVNGSVQHNGGGVSTEPLVHIHVFENVPINRGGAEYKSAEDAAERLVWLMSKQPGTTPPVYSTAWNLVDDLGDELAYLVVCTTRGPVTITQDEDEEEGGP